MAARVLPSLEGVAARALQVPLAIRGQQAGVFFAAVRGFLGPFDDEGEGGGDGTGRGDALDAGVAGPLHAAGQPAARLHGCEVDDDRGQVGLDAEKDGREGLVDELAEPAGLGGGWVL